MSGDELSYVPTVMNNHAQSNMFTGMGSVNPQPQGGSKRFSRRQRPMLDKQVN